MSRYKICVSVAAFLCVFLSAFGAPETSAVRNPAYVAYIEKWKSTALAQQAQYGIPASITLAQGLLESGAGQSDLATTANNHFGIKCHSDWQGGTFRKDDDKRDECFRSYNNADDSFRDHSLFLKRKRYEVLFTYDVNDYKAWANGLKACGYATDPNYPQKLIRIIETYDLANLDKASAKTEKQEKQEKTSKPEASTKPDKTSTKPRQNSDQTPTKSDKATKPTKPTKQDKTTKSAKPTKPAQPQVEQASADTVVWRPAQFRTNKLYAEHASGKTNGRKFIVAQEGDTWGSIAYTLGMEEKTLRRINEATDKQLLRGGDRIYLFPKRSKADKSNTRHLVQPGETAWDIAQHYGMKMSSLYKINAITEGTPLKTQQWLNLR